MRPLALTRWSSSRRVYRAVRDPAGADLEQACLPCRVVGDYRYLEVCSRSAGVSQEPRQRARARQIPACLRRPAGVRHERSTLVVFCGSSMARYQPRPRWRRQADCAAQQWLPRATTTCLANGRLRCGPGRDAQPADPQCRSGARAVGAYASVSGSGHRTGLGHQARPAL